MPVGSATCPVTALQNLVIFDPKPLTEPLFSDALGNTLSQQAFLAILKKWLVLIGVDESKDSGHSFCWGTATSAASIEMLAVFITGKKKQAV
ncbi:hypothetical protein CVT25_008905 [Psilocybe cyanescens]|uniref:Uncharacterized protein n=1 Tax=Psilocybe cyanescens TaxID=93625 RepID=A0A409XL87_PSICY|nr:hypothetical protein CVT25_008905 [Psilocybe cyanescens]